MTVTADLRKAAILKLKYVNTRGMDVNEHTNIIVKYFIASNYLFALIELFCFNFYYFK